MDTNRPQAPDHTEQTLDPIRTGLHEAGWYARGDLDPDLIDGIVSDVLDLLRENLTSTNMIRHVENFVPLGFDPARDPYPTVGAAAAAILAEAATHLNDHMPDPHIDEDNA